MRFCLFKNLTEDGAIFINGDLDLTVDRTSFHSCYSTHIGGGLYFKVITPCSNAVYVSKCCFINVGSHVSCPLIYCEYVKFIKLVDNSAPQTHGSQDAITTVDSDLFDIYSGNFSNNMNSRVPILSIRRIKKSIIKNAYAHDNNVDSLILYFNLNNDVSLAQISIVNNSQLDTSLFNGIMYFLSSTVNIKLRESFIVKVKYRKLFSCSEFEYRIVKI